MKYGIALLAFVQLSSAWAAPHAPAEEIRIAEAQRSSDLGEEAWARGDYLTALDHFEKSYAQYPSPNTRYNLAGVFSDLGRDLESLEAFEAFLQEAKHAPENTRSVARARIAVLEQRIAHLSVKCTDHGAQVSVDGKTIGEAPLARVIRVNPGLHQVTAQRAGYLPGLLTTKASLGETVAIDLKLHKFGERSIAKRWWFWTVLGVTAAGVATGVALGVKYGQPTTAQAALGSTYVTSGSGLSDKK